MDDGAANADGAASNKPAASLTRRERKLIRAYVVKCMILIATSLGLLNATLAIGAIVYFYNTMNARADDAANKAQSKAAEEVQKSADRFTEGYRVLLKSFVDRMGDMDKSAMIQRDEIFKSAAVASTISSQFPSLLKDAQGVRTEFAALQGEFGDAKSLKALIVEFGQMRPGLLKGIVEDPGFVNKVKAALGVQIETGSETFESPDFIPKAGESLTRIARRPIKLKRNYSEKPELFVAIRGFDSPGTGVQLIAHVDKSKPDPDIWVENWGLTSPSSVRVSWIAWGAGAAEPPKP